MTRRILTMALLISSAACASENDPTDLDDDDLTPGSMGSVTARIDGTAWTATAALGATHLGGVFGFAAHDANGRAIVIAVEASPAPGAVAIRVSDSSSLTLSITEANGMVWMAGGSLGTGQLNIDSFTTTSASGRFSFTAVAPPGAPNTGSKVVSDGVFNVRFVTP
jgi:hypothetical protein